jgi:anaerobic selenocysteine-containing dehydrogenase
VQDELHRGYGAMVVQRIRPAVAPRGEARSNQQIFSALARRLGFDGPDFDTDPDVLTRRWVAASKGLPADAEAKLRQSGVAAPEFRGTRDPVQFETVFPETEDGKIDLHPDRWRRSGHRAFAFARDPSTRAFPLALISPATRKTINSVLGETVQSELCCHLSAEDAQSRGIRDGGSVVVRSAIGSIRARARVDAALRPGVCMIPKGYWLRNCPSGANANALIASTVTPISGGATYNDTRVEVEAEE